MHRRVLGLPYSQNKHLLPTDVFRFIKNEMAEVHFNYADTQTYLIV
jgi:hypothetical protein